MYQWERGHQNDHKAIEELSFPAQMNVHVDGLAGEYNKHYECFRPIAPVLPSTPAHLQINNVTITSRYREQMQRVILEPIYMAYLMKRFKWSDGVLQDIAWKSLKLALVQINRTVLATKLCNNLLPANA